MILLGLAVLAGWLLHVPVLVQLAPGFAAMTYPAAVGFCLAGAALLAACPAQSPAGLEAGSRSPLSEQAPSARCTQVGDALAALLILFGVLALAQWIGGAGAGQAAPPWLAEADAYPGLLRPIAAVCFAAIGLTLVLLHRARTASMLMAVLLLTFAVMLAGFVGALGQILGLENIYKWYAGMPLLAGVGFVVFSVGLLSIEFRDARFQQYWSQDESRKISLVGAAILVFTALIGVSGGFAVLHPQAVAELQSNLQLSLKSRDEKFRGVLEQGWQDSFAFANQPLRLDAMKMLNLAPDSPALRAQLQKVAESSASFGFSAVMFRDAAGREIARNGSFTKDPELGVTINTASPSSLLWRDGFILHAHIDMVNAGQPVGTMDAERPLPRLGKQLHETAHLGQTTDFAVCAPARQNMHCFPFRSTGGKVLRDLPPLFNGRPIPASYALTGKTGVIHTRDYRGREVIAAYAPLGELGLGTVLKIDAAELYRPIASKLTQLLAILLVLTAAGIVLLRLQLLPLVRKMAGEIAERKKAEAQINFLAYHDPLTELPNRLLGQDRFRQAMAHADRNGTKAALLFLDLDSFKTINDSLGHSIGDALLKAVAARLRHCVRDTDTISRQGGDEFLVALTGVRDSGAITGIAEKILHRLVEPFEIENHELPTSFSIGIVVYPDDGSDFETLLKKADTAMYHAKDAGRNTYRFHTEQMNVDAVERLRMRNNLGKALERNEFVLYYQPQIDLASGAVAGAEALIRWNHPELGMVAPGRFIPVAEDSGLIVEIGDWVLREACRQAAAWRQAGQPQLTVAVNLSAVQFKRGNLELSVAQALAESGLDPAQLELELTESILIQDTDKVLATVQRLKTLGVKLSIDDFGTGYSSLSYLKRFAVDRLKIDQSFVRDMADDPNDAAIVNAIIQMAKSLNLKTIAEGVEDSRMLDLLRHLQCDEAQGYHFARPMPAGEFPAYLSDAAKS
ncbi:MAG: EAL domain-containing protein [Sulfuricella sp.]|nr:EAL domain-containing protein [Sulfuricella sp.]